MNKTFLIVANSFKAISCLFVDSCCIKSKKIFVVLICMAIVLSSANAQFFNKLKYGVEFGISTSIGPSVFGHFESSINSLGGDYYYYKRYRMPALRCRILAARQINQSLIIGLKGGVDIHYLERNQYGQTETNFSIPVQAFGEIKTFSLSKTRALFVGSSFGHDFKNLRHSPFTEKGGVIFSAEVAINKKGYVSNAFYYKVGFEYEAERHYVFFKGTAGVSVDETIKTKQRRRQLYFSLGINF